MRLMKQVDSGPDDAAALLSEIDTELEFHLEQAVEDMKAQGVSGRDAEAEVMSRFGDVDRWRRACFRISFGSQIMRDKYWVVAIVAFVAGGLMGPVMRDVDNYFSSSPTSWKRIGPFEGLIWQGETPVVLVENEWYTLQMINGLLVQDVLAHSQDVYEGLYRKRFVEDLYEVLEGMGHAVTTVDVVLTDQATGEEVVMQGLPMTREKRQKAKNGGWFDGLPVSVLSSELG